MSKTNLSVLCEHLGYLVSTGLEGVLFTINTKIIVALLFGEDLEPLNSSRILIFVDVTLIS